MNLPTQPINYRLFHHLRGAGRATEVLLQRELKDIGLPLAQFYVLQCLWQKDGVTQSWISEKTFMTEGVTSQLIKEMVKSERVQQHRDTQDKRKRLIFLNPPVNALKGPALDIWARCLKNASIGLTDAQCADYVSLSRRIRLNALTSYQQGFGAPKALRTETMGLLETLTLNTQDSLSVISPDYKFVYMNDRFRKFFDMPETALKVGDPAHVFYRRIAQNPAFAIEDEEAYIFKNLKHLRDLTASASIVRRVSKGRFFRITQRKLEDNYILTTTERLTDTAAAQVEMDSDTQARDQSQKRNDATKQRVRDTVSTPLQGLFTAVERLRADLDSSSQDIMLGEIEAAVSSCILRIEKTISEV